MEERSELRRQISEPTNSLSVSDRVRSISGYFLWRWLSGSRDTLVRERVSADKLGPCVLRAPSLTHDSRPSRTTRKSYGPRVPDRTMVATFDRVLLCWFRNRQASSPEVMKTAGRENPNHWGKVSSNRAHGAADQNRSCSIKWAAKQEKVRPLQGCFFLTFLFITYQELTALVGNPLEGL